MVEYISTFERISLRVLVPENKGITTVLDFGKYSSNGTLTHSRGLEFYIVTLGVLLDVSNKSEKEYEFSVFHSGVSQIHKLKHIYHVNIEKNNLLTLYIFTLITLKR